MRKWLLILWLFILFGCAGADAQSLAGTYTVTGTNADASQYTGRAEVAEHDQLIDLQIFDPEGNLMSIGVGLREGDVISLIFQTREGQIGFAIYRLENEQWIGRWHVPGTADVLKETLTKTDPRLHGAEQGPKSVL